MTELNAENFDLTINGDLPVIVDFWADWCMPCKILAPVFEEISDEFDGRAGFFKVNIDDCAGLAQQYDVAMIPTIMVFKNGKPVDKIVGVHPKGALIDSILAHI